MAKHKPISEEPPFKFKRMTKAQKIEALDALKNEVHKYMKKNWVDDGWTNVVFGEGHPNANLLFVGEGPGAEEDIQGRPFVGRSGKLLDKQLNAMGLDRSKVYIANIVKTRPPGNRVPTPDEAEMCMPFLLRQIEIIAPKVIVTLGASSAKYLLREPKLAITKERGEWRDFRGVALMPTFHPAYLLRAYTVENRQRVWSDLKKALEKLGLEVPKQG